MRNRSAIWVFTILLTLACLYQLSFSWVTGRIEKKAEDFATTQLDSVKQAGGEFTVIGRDTIRLKDGVLSKADEGDVKSYYESQYLAEVADEPAYPVLGLSYSKCKNQQLTKGLDLQGGMSVTLEISVAELVADKAGNSVLESFRVPYKKAQEQFGNGEGNDFVELFFQAYDDSEWGNDDMLFFNVGSKEEFPLSMSKAEIKEKLQSYAKESITKAQTVIENRVNRFGLGQIVVQPDLISGKLYIEIPGAKDKQRIRNMLQAQAKLEFWEGYNKPLSTSFVEINKMLGGVTTEELAVEDEKEEVADVDPKSLMSDSVLSYLAEGYVRETAQDSLNVIEAGSRLTAITDSLNSIKELAALENNNVELETTTPEGNNTMFNGRLIFLQNARSGGNGEPIYTPSIAAAVKASDTSFINLILANPKAKALLGNVKFLWSYKASTDWSNADNNPNGDKKFILYAVKGGEPRIGGNSVKSARYYTDPETGVAVSMQLKSEGGAVEEWSQWTSSSAGKYAGISMDDAIYSFPVINGPITGGNTQISGNFTLDEAEELAAILEAGSLPAPAIIVDEAMVGPELGAENVTKGLWSFVFALLAVLAYMIFYYNKAGVIASIALVANVFFILGTLASLGAALTLPGIAGLVLTIGMAVDANVLIFERIREELRDGSGLKQAIANGYTHAYSAILDSNITTLLTAIILAYFGSGPIQGFATTLIIGIFASLFSSIFITRLLFSHMLDRKMNVSFSRKMTENFLVGKNFDFLGNRKKYYLISAVVVLAGLGSLMTMGLSKSVEFTGGRTYTVAFSADINMDDVKSTMKGLSIDEETGKQIEPKIKTVDHDAQLRITTNLNYSKMTPEATAEVDAVLDNTLKELGFVNSTSIEATNNPELETYTINSQRSVNPQISSGLITKSLLAIALSLIAIFLYIGLRFNRWQFGLGALIAMFHDVLVVLGLFSLLWKFMPFSMEIDQAFIAAILTVIGYSINDTVVVYDRIREYIGLYKRDNQNEVINKALNTTLSRTINTSMTTFVVLLIIFLFGGDGISGFSFALMIGVVVGTYSSIFIATPSVVDLTKNLMPAKSDKKK